MDFTLHKFTLNTTTYNLVSEIVQVQHKSFQIIEQVPGTYPKRLNTYVFLYCFKFQVHPNVVPCLLLLPSMAQLTCARLSGTKVWLPRGREGEKKLIRQNYGLCKKVEFFPPYILQKTVHYDQKVEFTYYIIEIFKFILTCKLKIECYILNLHIC